MDQLDPIRVDDPEHGRGSQEGLRPVLMGREEAKEPRPLGEVGKQRAIVARQPAIERPVAPPLSACRIPRVTISLGHKVAWGCLGMPARWSSTWQNKAMTKSRVVIGSSNARESFTLPTSLEEVHDRCKTANEHYWFVRD